MTDLCSPLSPPRVLCWGFVPRSLFGHPAAPQRLVSVANPWQGPEVCEERQDWCLSPDDVRRAWQALAEATGLPENILRGEP